MNITDLTDKHVEELKKHLQVIDGKVFTKKIQEHGKMPTPSGKYVLTGSTRTSVGDERGGSNKYGKHLSFVFSDKSKLCCKSRELIWVFAKGMIPKDKSVSPINGDKFDDRLENLQLVKRSKNGRPRGATDGKKRARRIDDGYSRKDVTNVEKLRGEGLHMRDIGEKLGLSYGQVQGIVRQHLKPHMNIVELCSRETVMISDIESLKNKCGVYVISFQGERYSKFYIGSSINIRERVKTHRKDMESKKHYNNDMNEAYYVSYCKVRVHVWQECNEQELLKIENDLINKYCKGSLLNKWSNVSKDDIQEYLDVAVTKITPDRYEETIDGCWLWKSKNKSGYGKDMSITPKIRSKVWGVISSPIKFLKPHRVSYYKATGEYPELVRHKCGNRNCVNPDHLECGSHSDNGKDTHKNKWELFKHKWKEYDGDLVKMTEYFNYKKNYTAADGRRYYGPIKQIAKKLGLI